MFLYDLSATASIGLQRLKNTTLLLTSSTCWLLFGMFLTTAEMSTLTVFVNKIDCGWSQKDLWIRSTFLTACNRG